MVEALQYHQNLLCALMVEERSSFSAGQAGELRPTRMWPFRPRSLSCRCSCQHHVGQVGSAPATLIHDDANFRAQKLESSRVVQVSCVRAERSTVNHRLVLATDDGVVICDCHQGVWRESFRGLPERPVTSVAASGGTLLAGTTDGIFRSDDLGRTWQKPGTDVGTPHVRWLSYHPVVGRAFAGTEPAAIFIAEDGGQTWRECPEVARMREEHGWYLPYSPEAGCVRGFAFHGSWAYAAVEVGGALWSDDGGLSWRLADGSSGDPDPDHSQEGFIHPDLHSFTVHPTTPKLLHVPTGGGLYRSTDGGKGWELLYPCYCRAVWVDEKDADHLVFGPADTVSRRGRIEEARDGGRSWQLASSGLEVPWPRHMVERFLRLEGELLAVLSNGHLLAAPIETLQWRRLMPDVEGISAVALMPVHPVR
jgi:hypothetical protein